MSLYNPYKKEEKGRIGEFVAQFSPSPIEKMIIDCISESRKEKRLRQITKTRGVCQGKIARRDEGETGGMQNRKTGGNFFDIATDFLTKFPPFFRRAAT